MAKKRLAQATGDYTRNLVSEGGEHYRHHTQELQPAMDRVSAIRHAQEITPKGVMGKTYIGSVPEVVLHDWLKANGYKRDQFARNDGGTRCPPGMDPVAHCKLDGGVRSLFLRYFLSREFSKLHTQHSTSRIGTGNRIVVPDGFKGVADGNNEIPGVKAADS